MIQKLILFFIIMVKILGVSNPDPQNIRNLTSEESNFVNELGWTYLTYTKRAKR